MIYARRGLFVRIAYLTVAAVWVVTRRAWRRLTSRRPAPVTLCYHGVAAAAAPRFAWQMRRLAASPTAVRVTFDDAFANLLETALPITRDLGIPVTIFAVAENLGDRPRWTMPPGHPEATESTMSAQQLASLAEDPLVHIGSHSLSHAPLPSLAPEDARCELVQSRAVLERITGRPVKQFAFPHGAYDPGLITMAGDAGYDEVHLLGEHKSEHDPRSGPRSGPRIVPRYSMSPDVWPIEFTLTIAGGYAWLPALRRLARKVRKAGKVSGSRESRSSDPITQPIGSIS